MKHFFFFAFIAIISIAKAQITEVHTFDDNVSFNTVNGYPSKEYFFFSYSSNNEISLYKSDFSLYKQFVLSLPEGYNISSAQCFSTGIFTPDNRISFMIFAINASSQPSERFYIAIYDENSQLVQSIGYAESMYPNGVFIIDGQYYLSLLTIASRNADYTANYQTKIFKLNADVSSVEANELLQSFSNQPSFDIQGRSNNTKGFIITNHRKEYKR